MARQKNDGKGRLGGREKGTPNRVTTSTKEFICDLIDRNRAQMKRDLKTLTPKDRLLILEKLMQYAVPKQQAVTGSISVDGLTDEQVRKVVDELTKDVEE